VRVPDGSASLVDSSRPWRYGIAVLSVVVAVAVRLALDSVLDSDSVLGSNSVLFAFMLAIMAATRIGGRGPGLLASLLSVLAVWYFFIEHRFSFVIANPKDLGSLVVIAVSGAGISLLLGGQPHGSPLRSEPQANTFFLRRAVLFGGAFFILLVLMGLLHADFVNQKERQQWVTRSYQALTATGALLSNLQDAETGQRGYLLTGKESYREPFQSALREQLAIRRTLRLLSASNAAQQAILETVDRLVEAKFSELQQTMELRRTAGLDAALAVVRTGAGKRIMDHCRASLRALEEGDRQLLARQTRSSDRVGMRLRWLLGLGCGSLLMLLAIAAAVIERDSRSRERAREVVNRSELRLRLALDATNAGTWERNLETNQNLWSEELWKLYGIEPNSRPPTYDTWRELVLPDDRANAEQVVTQAFRDGTELNVEYRVRDGDGGTRWLLSRGRPVRDGEGRAARLVGIVLDITKRKRGEQTLRESEQNLRSFAEFAPVSIAMFDREMCYLAASRRFRDDYSLGNQELLGRSHYDVSPEIPEEWRETHRRCLAGAVERSPGEPFLRSDGTEQWLRREVQPWHHPGGSIGGIVLFSEDITAQKRSELALRESEARLRLAQQVARVGTFEWNCQTGVNTWTRELEAIYGLAPGEFAGTEQAWENLVHPDDRPEVSRQVQQAMETGKFETEWRVVWPDGTLRWLAGRAWVFKDDADKPLRLIGVNIDITEAKQAAEALRRTEAALTEAQRVAHLGSWYWDSRTDCVISSKELYNMWDLDPALPFPGFKDQERFFTAESWKRLIAARQVAAQTGDGYELDVELTRADGMNIWVATHGEAVRDIAGNITGLHCTIQDVTRRKRAEDALRESEEQFRTLANAILQLCWIAHADGGIFWYNQRWYEYTNTTPEQMEGWGWQSVHDPVVLPQVLDRWNASIATGTPFDMVFPLRGADGVFHPFLTRVVPLRDLDGKIVRWFGTNTDIREQKKAEDVLRQASEQRRLALEAAGLGAWDYRFEAGEVFWDDACCHMFGVPAGTITDDEAISRIHSEDRAATREALAQAIADAGGGAYHNEFRVVWADGSVHWILSHGRVYFEGEGGMRRPVRFIGVNMDITERKNADLEIQLLNAQLEQRVRQRTAQLEATNKELEAFSYSVSHDLRAPLRGIDGWSLALADDYAGRLDERAQRYLSRIRSETQRMGVLIDDMLELSRLTRVEMQFVPVDLTAIAWKIAAKLTEANADRHIEFVIEPGLTGTGDARLLEIALTNLISNAVKFTTPRALARIEFGQTSDNGPPTFHIRDNGAGFDMAYAPKLFRAYKRLHRASEFPGTGIGLATVQRVIHRHFGKVWAEGQVGQGATFHFTIGETI
jgi:PAS domain S-box-containing protein